MQKNIPEASEPEEGDRRLRRVLSRFGPRETAGWIADTGRFFWELGFLNLRKTIFRLRRGRSRCPCQNPSDSGRAGETGCDAVMTWHNPARFRRVCPLLQRMPDGGWRCSVDAADVRPFWGRAGGYLAGIALGTYLVGTLALFVFLRTVGYPVNYGSIAWPPAWHEVREARGRYFFAKAERALQANQPVPALMWLAQSYELDPANYSAGRILAQFWQASGPDFSSRLYRRLMKDHPEQRTATAQAWFMALLTHGDFTEIEMLAREELTADPPHASAWLNALLFANQRTHNQALLGKMIADAALPPYIRQICSWEIKLRTAGPDEARRLLTQPVPADAAPYLLYYRIDRLLKAGLADQALLELNLFRGRLSVRDQVTLELETYSALGWQSLLHDQVDRLLTGPLSAPLLELLCAHLIRHPDPVLLDKVWSAAYRRPLPADDQALGGYSSLFCAIGAGGDWSHLEACRNILQRITHSRYAALAALEAYFRGDFKTIPITRYLPALPALPIEVDYALFDFADLRRMAPNPARPVANAAISAP